MKWRLLRGDCQSRPAHMAQSNKVAVRCKSAATGKMNMKNVPMTIKLVMLT